ncbi:DUF3781 domain-containing protein [Vibrio harveyi]
MDDQLKLKISNEFKNTALGFVRIKKNLNLTNVTDEQLEALQKEIIQSTPKANIEAKGKNYYFKNHTHNTVLTINSHSLTIITAKQISV